MPTPSRSPLGANSKQRAIVVGLGDIGQRHAWHLSQHPDTELVGVVDTNPDRQLDLPPGSRAVFETDTATLLDRIPCDVVVIATPDGAHHAIAEQAFQAGCDVFCEKPLATDLAEGRAIVEQARRCGCRLAVNFNRRWGFGYQAAKRWVEAGEIGTPQQLVLAVSDSLPKPHLHGDRWVMLTTLLSHHLDLARWFLGELIDLHAVGRGTVRGLARQLSLTLHTRGGAQAVVTGVYCEGQSRTRETLILVGTGGQITVEEVTRQATLVHHALDLSQVARPPLFESGDGFWLTCAAHLDDFLMRRIRGEPPAVTGDDALVAMELAELARQQLTAAQH